MWELPLATEHCAVVLSGCYITAELKWGRRIPTFVGPVALMPSHFPVPGSAADSCHVCGQTAVLKNGRFLFHCGWLVMQIERQQVQAAFLWKTGFCVHYELHDLCFTHFLCCLFCNTYIWCLWMPNKPIIYINKWTKELHHERWKRPLSERSGSSLRTQLYFRETVYALCVVFTVPSTR